MSTSIDAIRAMSEQLAQQLLALFNANSVAPGQSSAPPRLGETDRQALTRSIAFVGGQNGGAATLTEDQLYAALTHARLSALNPELQKRFESDYFTLVEQFTAKGAENPAFKAADRIMRRFLREDQISREEYQTARDFAFGFAQFDGDRSGFGGSVVSIGEPAQLTALFDHLAAGRAAEPAEISAFRAEQAKISRKLWKAKKAEAISAAEHSSAAGGSATGAALSGVSGGFLWKPVSDSDGKLAILLPSSWTGDVAGVSVVGPDGRTIAEGRYAGNGNGARDHFRFNQPGSAFPAGCIVEVRMRDGTVRRIEIENPGARLESK